MSEIRLRVDDELLPLLGGSPEEIERHALEMIVLELYRRRAISAGRAAELLQMDQLAFVRWTGALGIPYFELSGDELREELRPTRRSMSAASAVSDANHSSTFSRFIGLSS